MVDVFRASEAALEITREAIRLRAEKRFEVVWMQLGVRNDVAAAEAEAAGLTVIMNRCPKIEYGRLWGELGWGRVRQRRDQQPLATSCEGRRTHGVTSGRGAAYTPPS